MNDTQKTRDLLLSEIEEVYEELVLKGWLDPDEFLAALEDARTHYESECAHGEVPCDRCVYPTEGAFVTSSGDVVCVDHAVREIEAGREVMLGEWRRQRRQLE